MVHLSVPLISPFLKKETRFLKYFRKDLENAEIIVYTVIIDRYTGFVNRKTEDKGVKIRDGKQYVF